jgi:hypothetical protein
LRDVLPTPVEASLRFADGPEQDVYMHLDQQILALTEQQERLVMATLSRTRGLMLDPNLPHPESLIAIALRHESRFYGVLWAAYNKQRIFSEADLRFISTLRAGAGSCEHPFVPNGRSGRRQLGATHSARPGLVTDVPIVHF